MNRELLCSPNTSNF